MGLCAHRITTIFIEIMSQPFYLDRIGFATPKRPTILSGLTRHIWDEAIQNMSGNHFIDSWQSRCKHLSTSEDNMRSMNRIR